MKRVLKSKSNIKKADKILRKRNVSKAQDGTQAYPYDTDPGIDMEKYLRSQDVRGRIAKQYFEFVNPNPTNEELESYINSEIDRRISDYRRLKEIPWDERNERVKSELKKSGIYTDDEIDKIIRYDDIVLRGVYTGGRNHDISMNPSPGFSNQTPFDNQSTKFHETYHGINRGGQTPMELAKFDPVVLDRPDDERAKLNQSNYEGIAQGKIGNPIYMDTKGNIRTASRARDGSQGTYDRRVEELGPRLWQLRNWAHQMGISKDGGNLTPEQIDQIINFDFSDTSKIRPEDASLIKELIDDLHNRLVKIPKQYNSDEEIPDDYKDYNTLKSRLLEAMNYFVDTEGKDNSAVSTAKQGGVISKKQLGGLASLPFNRLIKNKNMKNPLKYQQGDFVSLVEAMRNDPKAIPQILSTKGGSANQYLSMPMHEQKRYYQKLLSYVNDFGVEALSQNPKAEEFFMEFSNKMAAPQSRRTSTDPVQGGPYVSAIISERRIVAEEKDPIKDFIRSPKIQSENFQDFSATKIPEILLEDYEVSVSSPNGMGFVNRDILGELGLKTTVYGPEMGESKRTIKRVKQAKNGGNVYSKMGLKPMGVFYNGGSVDPAFQRNMPVGNSKRIDGYLPMESLIPIQTEKDELIVLPTKDVVKVNATKRHSKMTDDEVTDIVPDGSYILSQYGDVDIYKEEADNYIIETKNKPYNIHQQNKPPTIKTLGSFMSKKKMKPADLARKILAKYKTVNLDDPFVNDTNRANKFTASRYLDAIIELSELDKRRKGLDENPEAQMYEQSPEMFARNGGRALKASYKVPKAEAGAIAGAAAGLLSGILSAYTDAQNRKLIKQNTAASLKDIENLSKQQLGYENLGLAAGLFNPQDPTYREPRYQYGYLQGIRNQGLGNQELDYFSNRAFANLGAAQNAKTYDPREAMALNTAGYATALDAMSKASLENARRRDALETDYYKNLGAGRQFDEAARAKEFNITTANVNKSWADKVAQIMGSMTNRSNLLSNEMALRLAARNQQTPALVQLNNQLAQNLMNSAQLGLQTYSTLNKANSSAAPAYVGTVGEPSFDTNFPYPGPYPPGTRMCKDAQGNIVPC